MCALATPARTQRDCDLVPARGMCHVLECLVCNVAEAVALTSESLPAASSYATSIQPARDTKFSFTSCRYIQICILDIRVGTTDTTLTTGCQCSRLNIGR